jgi:hypothetical protein
MRRSSWTPLGANTVAALLLSASPLTSFCSSPMMAAAVSQTTHIRGFVRSHKNVVVTPADLTFRADAFSKTISVDARGFYDTELPVGLYTLYVLPRSGERLEDFHHPLFSVPSNDISLNLYVAPFPPDCDRVGPPPGAGSTATRDVVICGGEDSFAVPSEDETPFELDIRYQTRRHGEQGSPEYSSEEVPQGHEVPVFLAYNLFTLRAQKVVYDTRLQTLTATGDVVAERSDGTTMRGNSARFRIENGAAIQLR